MEATARSYSRSATRAAVRPDPAAVGAWLLAFAPILFLGLKGGGYDIIVRSEAGIAMFWILALGAIVGVIPRSRFDGRSWAVLGSFAAFTAWTGLSVAWSESAERSIVELARVVTFGGMLALALTSLDRRTARSALHGAGVAMGAVCALGVLSRVEPGWFPADDVATFLASGETRSRLNYPLNYSDAVGSFAGMAVPLLAAMMLTARTNIGRALSCAAVPVALLAMYLSASRGGFLAAVTGLLALLVLAPRRDLFFGVTLSVGAGAILMAAASDRLAFREAQTTALGSAQAEQMVVFLIVVCLGAGLTYSGWLTALANVAPRRRRAPASPAVRRGVGAALVAGVIVAALAGGLAGQAQDAWREFKSPAPATASSSSDLFDRFANLSGARYEYWMSALRAGRQEPLTGIGAGTFESWWARDGAVAEFVRDAHSLYFETLAELGYVGLALLLIAFALVLGIGAVASRRGADGPVAAGATAGFVAFMAGASLNWNWEVTVLPLAAFLLAAVAVAAGRRTAEPAAPLSGRSRAAIVVACAVAVTIVAVPFASTAVLREGQADARAGMMDRALNRALEAQKLQPYAATPRLQEALVRESLGDLAGAGTAVAAAAERDPRNWRIWLIRSRIAARNGDTAGAIAAYREAKSLNPRSPLFNRQ